MADQKPEPVPLLIQGLIGELPPRKQGFPRQDRDRWLAALKVNLDLVYGETGEVTQEGAGHVDRT